ncbi:hypothetical protein [Streptomyces sp. NPDC058441]|uniref:hypothetical protein n=1 Tax=Streptomyces sp. NPDC058441 TaxID=3346502 RepID=UPI003660BC1C
MSNTMGTRPGANRGPYSNRDREIITLPAAHGLPVPEIPPVKEWSPYELSLWTTYWESPQASQWGDDLVPAVASLVAYQVKQMTGGTSAHENKFVADMIEALGISPQAQKRLSWKVQTDG